MGYGMAVNLRSKLDKKQTLYICDTNKDAIHRFQQQMASHGPIEVVQSGAEAVKRAVSSTPGFCLTNQEH